MSEPLLEINRTLGAVLAKLENIETVTSDLSDNVTGLLNRTAVLENDMNATKPYLDKAKKWEQRGIGAAFVLTSLGAIFGSFISEFKDNFFTSIGMK